MTEGEIQLHLPSICIAEARRPILEKFQVRLEADRVRRFLLWAKQNGVVDAETDQTVRTVLDRMEARVKNDLEKLDEVLRSLRDQKGIDIFDLTQAMCEYSSELCHQKLGLNPFHQSILAAVLVRSDELRKTGVDTLAFCEPDSDLQPWDRNGEPKKPLVKFYDDRRIWVYQDFLLQEPKMRDGWP